jgi:hypothetical protein
VPIRGCFPSVAVFRGIDMGGFWKRLLACERRTERFLRIILAQRVQIRTLQQQLRDQRGG